MAGAVSPFFTDALYRGRHSKAVMSVFTVNVCAQCALATRLSTAPASSSVCLQVTTTPCSNDELGTIMATATVQVAMTSTITKTE